MLEIRNISKTYRAKSGVAVKALDHISLTFPDKGMVFLLGKSGSGKSTLLNVLGGLDTFDADGGEVLIKGRSSRDFRRSDFDAYRNTFIGFVFQEYNILDEFSVGANIALALQLQGKRADNAAINALLEQVDLAGYGHRKPNELSGGQKQRVAIARALIKNPEIIMADEPTGALDSTTGEQVFETLKKLSEEKLVLVVSHDRDFAERFGDRIIELSDGHIISDMTLTRGGVAAAKGLTTIGDDMIRIRRGYTLTAEDLALINAYLAKGDRDVILSKNEKLNGEVCAAAGISDEVGATEQRPTGKVETRTYNPEETKFIRSHLPLRNAFKMGVGGMKRRPVRLLFTMLLSFIAFALFGLADTMASYNQNRTVVDSLADSSMPALAVSVKLRNEYIYYDGNGKVESTDVNYYQSDALSDEDLRTLEARTGKKFYPVYNGTTSASEMLFESTILNSSALTNKYGDTFWKVRGIYGYIEVDETIARELGMAKISGAFPQATDEIMITKYHFDMWKQGGMILADGTRMDASEVNEESILGKTIGAPVRDKYNTRNFRIVGILDTGLSTDGYKALLPDYQGERLKEKRLETLYNRLAAEVSYSYHALFFGAPGLFDTFPKKISDGSRSLPGIFYWVDNGSAYLQEVKKTASRQNGNFFIVNAQRIASSEDAANMEILWLEAGKSSMGANDLVLSLYDLFNLTLEDMGFATSRATAEDLIPALRDDVSGWTYQRLFAERDQLWNTYNSRVPGDRKESANAFADFLTEKMNARFGVTYSLDDWEMLLQSTSCDFREEDAQTLSVALSCFEWSDNLTYVESLEYLRFVEAQYDAFAAKAEEADSPFRAFLTTYRQMTVAGGNRILTSADAGYHGYLVASAMLYLRGAALGAYPQAAEDIAWANDFPETGLKALAAVRYADYADILGVELTPEQLEMLHYSDTQGTCGDAYDVYSALYGESANSTITLNTLFRLSAALKFVTQNDEAIRAALEDKSNPFTKYVIDRTYSYIYDGDGERVPQLPKGRDDALNRFFWALTYLLRWDDQYVGAFSVNIESEKVTLGEDFLAAHLPQIPDLTMDFIVKKYGSGGDSTAEAVAGLTGMKVTGYFRSTELSSTETVIFSDLLYAEAKQQAQKNNDAQHGDGAGYSVNRTGKHDSGRYAFALMSMKDASRGALETLTGLHYDETGEFGFRMTNEVVETMDNWGDMIGTMRKVFLWIGLGFALFAALMMLNFVSATVTDKKREIGILRAVGARSADVFLIFFAEAFVVAMLNFVLAAVATGIATAYINMAIRQELGFALTLLHFGVRQVGLIFVVSLAVAVLGTLLPASKIAKKTPVDAMRDK